MPESVGTVHLSISADLKGLESKLKSSFARMAPQLGREFSDQFSNEFSKHLTPAMTSAVRGAFNKAQRSLTNIHINVVADLDLKGTQARLDKLGSEDLTVTVNADLDDAKAKAELDKLASDDKTVHVNVDVDSKKAKSGLKDLTSGISDVTNGLSTIGLMGVASMGTLIPVAVAATGAVLALGTVAVGVGASFAVAGLAFSGVGTALTALDNQQSKAGESAAQAASAALSLANAQDSLKSAVQGVRDAQEQAATATEQASRRTADAEKALQQAQADELQTQRDLNAAREQAIRDLEDIANRAADAALNQRQAAMDLTDAEDNYQKVLANPKSTQAQKDRAQLQRDQSAQRKKEADEEAKRSADDAAKAKKAGVEGSNAVTSAKAREKAATDKVHQAEQDVIDARKNEAKVAQQNAQAIAKAEQGVLQAQRSIQAALLAQQQVGASLRNAVNEAMADLPPAAQHFAKFIFGLKDDLDGLRAAAASSLLPPLEQAIKILLPYLPKVESFVSHIGSAMGDVAIKIAKMFTDKDFRSFFALIAKDAPGQIRTLGSIFVSLGHVIIRVFKAAEPYANTLLQNVADFFKNLDHETSGKKGEGKLKALFDGIMPVLGAAWNVIKSIGNVIGSIVTAGGSGKKSAAQTLNDIAEAINKLATYIDQHPDLVGKLVNISASLLALKAASPVIGVIGSVSQMIGGLAGVLKLVPWGAVFGAISGGIEAIAAAIGIAVGPFLLIIGVIAAVGVGLYLLYTKCQWFHDGVNTIVSKIGDFFTWLWRNAIKPALTAIGKGFVWLYQNVIKPNWDLIKVAIDVAWAAIQVTWGAIQIALIVLGKAFSWLYDHVIKPVWDAVSGYISDKWKRYIKPVFDTLGSYIKDHVAPKFQAAINGLKAIWDQIQDWAKYPIFFVLDTVLNNGLLKGYNWLASKFNVDPHDVSIDIPASLRPKGHATGGRILGPGSGTSDSIPAWLSNGEHVWTAREVQAAGGHQAVEAIRSAVLDGTVPGFAFGGGVWDWVKDKGSSAGHWIGDKAKNTAKWVGDTVGDITSFVTDPIGALKKLATSAFDGLPGGRDGMIQKLLIGTVGKAVDGMGNFVKGLIGMGGGGDSGTLTGGVSSAGNTHNQDIGQTLAASLYNWTGGNWNALRNLWMGESGWNERALNASSGAYGIPQSLPASKMAAAGTDWRVNPATQIRWGLKYIHDAYGSPANAWAQWQARSPHWYDDGGWLQPGTTLVRNDTGKPEAVFNPSQWAALEHNLLGGDSGDYSKTTNIDVHTYGDPNAIALAIAAEQGRADLLDAISL